MEKNHAVNVLGCKHGIRIHDEFCKGKWIRKMRNDDILEFPFQYIRSLFFSACKGLQSHESHENVNR